MCAQPGIVAILFEVNDDRMVWLARIVAGVLADAGRLVLLLLRSSTAIRAENLVLRKQLAHYIERGIKPGRVNAVTRIGLALLTRLFDWHDAVVIVRPKTIIRWHRSGWRLFWRLKWAADTVSKSQGELDV